MSWSRGTFTLNRYDLLTTWHPCYPVPQQHIAIGNDSAEKVMSGELEDQDH